MNSWQNFIRGETEGILSEKHELVRKHSQSMVTNDSWFGAKISLLQYPMSFAMSSINQTRFSGYMAITVAVILTIFMILGGFSLSFKSLYGRSNTLAWQSKQKSSLIAQSCLEEALLNLSQNSQYQGNESIAIVASGESFTCTILPLTTAGANKDIKVKATIQDSTTNLIATVNAVTLARVSSAEVKSF